MIQDKRIGQNFLMFCECCHITFCKKLKKKDTKRVSKQGLMKGPCVFVFVCVEWPNSSCDLGEASSRFWQRVNQGRNNKDSLYVAKLFACFWQSSEKILTAWRPTAGCWGQNCQSPEDEADSETSFYCFVFFLFWANASTSAKILIRLLRSPPSQKYSHPTDIFTCCRVSLFFCCFFSFVFLRERPAQMTLLWNVIHLTNKNLNCLFAFSPFLLWYP